MTHKIGLTGSIGMGKSTTAQMFAEEGIPVWDADQAVHDLYAPGGAAASALQTEFPNAIVDQAVSRDELKLILVEDPKALTRIEAIVHPLVADHRANFLGATSADIVVLDIPLLFETGANTEMDTVIVVTAPYETQRDRVLARPGMTKEQFRFILSKQTPDTEKRARADFVIETVSMSIARNQVSDIIKEIRVKLAHA